MSRHTEPWSSTAALRKGGSLTITIHDHHLLSGAKEPGIMTYNLSGRQQSHETSASLFLYSFIDNQSHRTLLTCWRLKLFGWQTVVLAYLIIISLRTILGLYIRDIKVCLSLLAHHL